MIQGSLSRRYAKALFQLAVAENKEDAVAAELARFAEVFAQPELNGVLNNPGFAAHARKNIVIQVARALELSPLVTHFLSLLVDHDRLGFYPGIVERYRRMLDEKKGQAEARVIAASPLQDLDLKRLTETLEAISGKKIVMHQEADAGLIGGAVVHLEGKIYDGSVRAQLEKMKKQVEQSY
ncbi:MAG TPA: ATP synthase F1 subunit delta [Verrucomicrobiae bacterium]|jgi:F-type H+-transporting ATPase subunit delta|nr:ATP synthase F1 subunit delta [Verrucomicrobiae bacterium]